VLVYSRGEDESFNLHDRHCLGNRDVAGGNARVGARLDLQTDDLAEADLQQVSGLFRAIAGRFKNRMESVENMVQMSDASKNWLIGHRMKLQLMPQ
jgi:hypothetical protein